MTGVEVFTTFDGYGLKIDGEMVASGFSTEQEAYRYAHKFLTNAVALHTKFEDSRH